jgi:hypothetical protein
LHMFELRVQMEVLIPGAVAALQVLSSARQFFRADLPLA